MVNEHANSDVLACLTLPDDEGRTMTFLEFLAELKKHPERCATSSSNLVRAIKSQGEVDYDEIAKTNPRRGRLLKMLKKLAPMAGMLPMLGGGMNSQLAMSAVSQGVMQAQMQDAQEDAMANAMSAINGAQKSNVKAGDSLSLQYRLVRVGEEQPTKSSTIVVKAKANGDDVLSPMLETVATDVVGSVASH